MCDAAKYSGCCSESFLKHVPTPKWGFPKIRGTILGVPVLRIIVFWGLYWGLPILGNYLNFEKLTGVISMLESLEEKFVDETTPDLDRLLRFVLVVSQH